MEELRTIRHGRAVVMEIPLEFLVSPVAVHDCLTHHLRRKKALWPVGQLRGDRRHARGRVGAMGNATLPKVGGLLGGEV
eukprot:5839390-Pleurochrysis_carterae.AAC.1